MDIIISVWQDEQLYVAGFVKGQAEMVFVRDLEKDCVLAQAANVAIEFDVDLHVMGRLADPYEIRDA